MEFIFILSVYQQSILIFSSILITENVISTLVSLYSFLIVTIAIEKNLISKEDWPCEINGKDCH